jgi:hypothetical protein
MFQLIENLLMLGFGDRKFAAVTGFQHSQGSEKANTEHSQTLALT